MVFYAAGEESKILPFQDSADVEFNSAQIYEFALLKPCMELLLFGVSQDCREYLEAEYFLKF